MSVTDLPDMKMFWSKDLFFGRFALANVMCHSRFERLSQYFHVADRSNYNQVDPNHDKLHLVREIPDFINQNCVDNYRPHKESSIDEAMTAFRGTLGFRQYMSSKPTKYGIKVWVHADSTNGYTNKFKVYVGRPVGHKWEVGLGQNVVLSLTEKLAGKNNHIYFQLIGFSIVLSFTESCWKETFMVVEQ